MMNGSRGNRSEEAAGGGGEVGEAVDLGLPDARVRAILAMAEAAIGAPIALVAEAPAVEGTLGAPVAVGGAAAAWLACASGDDGAARGAVLRLAASHLEAEARAAALDEARPSLHGALDLTQALVDSVSGPLCFKDTEGRYLGSNSAFLTLVGRDRDEVVGRTAFDVLPREVATIDSLRDEEVLRVDGVRITEESLVGTDGVERDYLVDRAVFLGPTCEVAGVITMMTDITERRAVERRVAASERRLAQLVENTPLAIIEWDADFRVRVWNAAAERIFGWRAAEVIGERAADRIVPPHIRPIVDGVWRDLVGQRGGRRSQNDNVTRDGRAIVCDWYNVPLVGPDGVATGAVSIVDDVTDRLAAQTVLRVREEQLRQAQKMEAIGRLAGGVAHDFNNILLVINSTAEIALEALDEHAPERPDFETILASGERAAGLTRQLLAFSRKQVLALEVVCLSRVVRELGKLVSRLIGEHIRVRLELEEPLWPVLVDRVQIDQVLINLAINARDAMPQGGELAISTRNLRLEAPTRAGAVELPAGDFVVLEVTDDGHGMTDDVRARIFEPFFTTKGPGEGTGLGLATVFGIVDQSGGRVDVASAPGAGATFRVYLPRTNEVHVEARHFGPGETRSRGGEVVLLVEDDPAVRQLVHGILLRAGYEVIAAADGAEALALARSAELRIHVLLTDVIMPGMNGGELVRAMASLRPTLPFLFMSGYTGDLLAQTGLADTANILYKPFTPDELCARLRDLLDGRAPVLRTFAASTVPPRQP
jgi:PAS domain S-box-containing protein